MPEVTIQVEGNVEWKYCQEPKSRQWVAACPPLGITIEAETLAALHASMSEAIDLLMQEMLSSGDLPKFLNNQGWKIRGQKMLLQKRVGFDVPLSSQRVRPTELLIA